MKDILKYSKIYNLFTTLIGGSKARAILSRDYIKSDRNKRILDLCCGTCSILPHLEFKEYIGVDICDQYIKYNKKIFTKYKNVTFIKEDIKKFLISNAAQFDIVLFLGGMHHINDQDLISCLKDIHIALKPDGKLITFDGCLEPNLSPLTKIALNNDRGLYVRTKDAWIKIFTGVFKEYKYSIRKDLLRIPYNHIIFYK